MLLVKCPTKLQGMLLMVGRCRLKRLLPAVLVVWTVLSAVASAAHAQDLRFVRIGTGPSGATYFPVGGLIANAISNPPGSRSCDLGGSCGVPGLIAAAVSTQGSVANVMAVADGALDMGLTQADVGHFAYSGTGVFASKQPLRNLRAVANLFPESVHLVTLRESAIDSVAELKGKRVSLGEPDSGTLITAELVLNAFGLRRKDVAALHERLDRSGEMIADGEMDAYFMVGAAPISAIAQTAHAVNIRLVPIAGRPIERMTKAEKFFQQTIVPDGTYEGVPATETLSVSAQLIVSSSMDAELVYAITRALWQPRNRKILDSGHSGGQLIQLATALEGIAIPLHPGAKRFYNEAGLAQATVR